MKLLTTLCLGALTLAPLSTVACSHSDDAAVSADDAFTGTLAVGTYVTDGRPFGSTYVSRITISSGQKFEADVVSGSGDSSLLAGSYVILGAHANDPDSPVPSDKPTLVLQSDSGGAGISFEYDKLSDGGLRLYTSGREDSFTMEKDANFQPAPTTGKVITCTGNAADVKLTLDQAQNRRGTLVITRKAAADRHDPPSVSVTVTQNSDENVPGYIYFEGQHGEQDYYVNMKEDDFDRGTGSVTMNMRWAEGGQELSIGGSCAFSR